MLYHSVDRSEAQQRLSVWQDVWDAANKSAKKVPSASCSNVGDPMRDALGDVSKSKSGAQIKLWLPHVPNVSEHAQRAHGPEALLMSRDAFLNMRGSSGFVPESFCGKRLGLFAYLIAYWLVLFVYIFRYLFLAFAPSQIYHFRLLFFFLQKQKSFSNHPFLCGK